MNHTHEAPPIKSKVLPRLIAASLLGLAVMTAGSAVEAASDSSKKPIPINDSKICAQLARVAEQSLGIPEHLLRAVSTVESGRYVRSLGRAEPWPWTINAAGKGSTFRSKADAIAEIDRLLRQGMISIDVGCMQVNLAYHGEAFDGIEDALDPVKNVAYAAHLLVTLKEQHGSWSAAVAAYHSSKPERAIPCCQKVAKAWEGFGGYATEDAIKLRRAAVRQNFNKQRDAFTARQARILDQQADQRRARQKPLMAAAERAAIARGGRPPSADGIPGRLMLRAGFGDSAIDQDYGALVGYMTSDAARHIALDSRPIKNTRKVPARNATNLCFDIVMNDPAGQKISANRKRG